MIMAQKNASPPESARSVDKARCVFPMERQRFLHLAALTLISQISRRETHRAQAYFWHFDF